MTASTLIVVAQLLGAFGVKGEARVRSFTDDPEAFLDYGPLLDAQGKVVLTPVSSRPLNEGYGVTTEEKVQREHWEDLRGTLLHVPREALPDADDDEVYVSDLIGLDVVHVDGRALGRIVGAPNFGAGDLIEVKPEAGPSLLLPFTREIIVEVDLAARVVRVKPDEAYLA